MGKCFRTVYFDAENYLAAEKQGIDFNSICNEAVKMAINPVSTPASEALKMQAELSKDNQTMLKYSLNKGTKHGYATWVKAVGLYGEKYKLSEAEVIRKFN